MFLRWFLTASMRNIPSFWLASVEIKDEWLICSLFYVGRLLWDLNSFYLLMQWRWTIMQWQIDKTVYVAAETTQLLQKVLCLPF